MKSTRLGQVEQRLIVNAKRRQYACPICGGGELVGCGCRPETHHVSLDRYLLPVLVPEVRLWVDRQYFDYRNLARFNLFICPRCYFMFDGPVVLRAGELIIDKRTMTFARRAVQGLSPDEGEWPLGAIFWDCVKRQAPKLAATDWFAQATVAGLLTPRCAEVFRGKPQQFNGLIRTLLEEKNPLATQGLLARLDPLLCRGVVDLITWDSFRSRPILFALHEARLLHLALIVGRENDRPFRVNLGGDPLDDVARFLLAFQQGRMLVHSAAGSILTVALRMARFAPNKVDLWWCKQIALLASEMIVRAGFYDYRDAEIRPHLVEENNEAVRYLNLLLRRELGMTEAVLAKEPALLRLELNHGLNRCVAVARGAGTPAERRASRLCTQIEERIGRQFPPGFLDIHEITVS